VKVNVFAKLFAAVCIQFSFSFHLTFVKVAYAKIKSAKVWSSSCFEKLLAVGLGSNQVGPHTGLQPDVCQLCPLVIIVDRLPV
jgi:hypothetical protein